MKCKRPMTQRYQAALFFFHVVSFLNSIISAMLFQRLCAQIAASVTLILLPQAVQGSESNLADDVISSFSTAVDCASCHSLLVTLKATAALGDAVLGRSLKALCKRLKVCFFYNTHICRLRRSSGDFLDLELISTTSCFNELT